MSSCRVPRCSHATDREICKPHWRRVRGDIKRLATIAQERGDKTSYEAAIEMAIIDVRHARNVV
jgi:hypothetical protein